MRSVPSPLHTARLGLFACAFFPWSARGETTTATAAEVIVVRGRRDPAPALAPVPDGAVDLSDRPLRFESLGDVVAELPGTTLLRRGGAGAPELLSIRGADFDQTTILVGDVPISGPDRGAVDLSLLPLAGFERVELFRGSAPIRYGAGTIGGVVRLVPKEATRRAVRARASGGSFDTWRGRLEGEAWIGDLTFVGAADGFHADNDFVYLDDNATFADPTDDVRRTRANADVDQGSGFLTLGYEHGAHRVRLLGLFVERARGIPGPATGVSLESRRRRTRAFGSLGYRHDGTIGPVPVDAYATASLGWDRDRVRDLEGAVGQGREDTDDRFLSLDLRAGIFADPFSGARLGVTASWRRDDLGPMNRFSVPGDAPSERDLFVAAGELRFSRELLGIAWALRASASAQATWSRLRESRFQAVFETSSSQVTPVYAVDLEARALGPCTAQGGVASGLQLPTTLQLFGNRDTIVGNVELEPERSLETELELACALRTAPLELSGAVGGFFRRVDDIIVARRTAQNTVAFRNERVGETFGLEGRVAIELFERLASTTSLTVLEPRFDNRGFTRREPLRPALRIFERLGARAPLDGLVDEISAFAELDHRSGFFADAANLVAQPELTIINAGVRASALGARLAVSATARNLTDELALDLLAFPRPGRAFELALEWKESFQ